jgi:predicted DCC family thiol-disulfide oxidoreductase YuxK
MARKTLNIIYDGHCGFCIRSLRIVKALDLTGAFRFHDSHVPETLVQFPALSKVNIDDAMYTSVEGEPLYDGFFAFRRLVWANPVTWLLLPVLYFPGARFLGPRVYAWVARNRNKFGCQTAVCDLQSSPRV